MKNQEASRPSRRMLRRDGALVAAIVALTGLALFGGYAASRHLAARVTEAHALNLAAKFTGSLANALTVFDPSGRFLGLDGGGREAVYRFARDVAHIDRVVVIGADRIVAFDSAGTKTGRYYNKSYITDALERGRATAGFADLDDMVGDDADTDASYVAETYVPVQVDGRVVGVFELYLNVSDYVASVQAVFRLAYGIFAVAVLLATVVAVGLVDRSMRRRRADLQQMQRLRDAAETARAQVQGSLEQQQRFTANAAHELRTPLAVLRARLDGLGPGPATAALAGDVDRMTRLVEQLLAVARLEAGLVTLEDGVDLTVVAQETVGRLFPLALAAGKTIALEAPEQPVLVRGAGFALEDALRNLIDNALRFTDPGGVVDVVVSSTPAGAALAVLDRGPGVPAGLRGHLFEPFVHGRDRRGAAGLGLAIVAETAALHGGTATVADRPGGGAAFRLSFPFPADETERHAA